MRPPRAEPRRRTSTCRLRRRRQRGRGGGRPRGHRRPARRGRGQRALRRRHRTQRYGQPVLRPGTPPAWAAPREESDQFGSALAAGDFNGDRFDDLAVGAPSETVGAAQSAGAINVLFGSASWACRPPAVSSYPGGLGDGDCRGSSSPSAKRWRPATSTATASTTLRSAYRSALPRSRPVRPVRHGRWALHRRPSHVAFFTQDSPGVGGGAEPFDQFLPLATGDFNNSGVTDWTSVCRARRPSLPCRAPCTSCSARPGHHRYRQPVVPAIHPGVPSDSEEGDSSGPGSA